MYFRNGTTNFLLCTLVLASCSSRNSKKNNNVPTFFVGGEPTDTGAVTIVDGPNDSSTDPTTDAIINDGDFNNYLVTVPGFTLNRFRGPGVDIADLTCLTIEEGAEVVVGDANILFLQGSTAFDLAGTLRMQGTAVTEVTLLSAVYKQTGDLILDNGKFSIFGPDRIEIDGMISAASSASAPDVDLSNFAEFVLSKDGEILLGENSDLDIFIPASFPELTMEIDGILQVGSGGLTFTISDPASTTTMINIDGQVIMLNEGDIRIDTMSAPLEIGKKGSITMTGEGSVFLTFTTGTMDSKSINRIHGECGVLSLNGVVTPFDTEPPEVVVKGDSTVNLELDEPFVDDGAQVSDNCDDSLVITVSGDTVDVTQEGKYEIDYTATDTAGNVGQARRIVKVKQAKKGGKKASKGDNNNRIRRKRRG